MGKLSYMEFLVTILVLAFIVMTIAVGHIATWW